MKKISRMLVKCSKRLLALMLAIVTVVSVNAEGLTVFAEEVRDATGVFKGEAKAIEGYPDVLAVSTKDLPIVNNKGPQITLELSTEEIDAGEDVSINFDATDYSGIKTMNLYINGESVLDHVGVYNYRPSIAGEEVILAKAIDNEGNESVKSAVIKI